MKFQSNSNIVLLIALLNFLMLIYLIMLVTSNQKLINQNKAMINKNSAVLQKSH